MAVKQKIDGALSLLAVSDENNILTTLPDMNEYIGTLNTEYNAECPINNNGDLADPNSLGNFVRQENNKLGIILGKNFNPVVYRGLNNDYCFMPTSLRYELFDPNERIRHSIEWIKKNEFLDLISNTDYYKRSKLYSVKGYTYNIDLESIAKIYNFVSNYIDITRDITVAYFYAYTYVDKEKNQVMPITNFGINSPTLYVSNLRKLYNTVPDAIKNISYQPFIRAKIQQSMSINSSVNYDAVKNAFIKVDLPKNPKISEYVYNLFEGGKKLFPGDYAAKYAVKVKNGRILPEKLFIKYCEETNTDEKWLEEQLTGKGYKITSLTHYIDEDAKYIINRELDEIIFPFINSSITV